jgi:hypothetical protein
MELNVRIAVSQLVDNKKIYEEISPVLVLSNFIPAPNQNSNFYTLCMSRFVKQITHRRFEFV